MANNSNTPTLKQKAFAKKYIEYKGNATKAALETYDVKSNRAHTLGYQNINKPVVQKEINRLLDENGLDLNKLTYLTNDAILNNLENGKASQAVGADLLKFVYKLHNAIPKDTKTVVKQEYKVLLSKEFSLLKEELTQSVATTQELLKDL